MPWGKHKFKSLSEIPGSYLWWVIEDTQGLNDHLRNAILRELSDRLPKPVVPKSDGVDRRKVIDWCRRASLVCHPDLGGSVRAMALVNELRQMVDQGG